MARLRNSVETLLKISTCCVGCTNVTDDDRRQTELRYQALVCSNSMVHMLMSNSSHHVGYANTHNMFRNHEKCQIFVTAMNKDRSEVMVTDYILQKF